MQRVSDALGVLDAAVVLAAFLDESGADRIAEQLSGAPLAVANYAEVVAKFVDRGIRKDRALKIMAQFDVEMVQADRDQAATAGPSLGARAWLALAISYGSVPFTIHQEWETILGATHFHVLAAR